MTIEDKKGVTVAQVAALQPDPAVQVRIEGCPPPPERIGLPRQQTLTEWVETSTGDNEMRNFVPPPVQPENTLDSTVRNPVWLAENREKLRELFPETYTHPANINFMRIRYQLKLYGVDYRSEPEFVNCLVELNKANVIKTDGQLIRRGYP